MTRKYISKVLCESVTQYPQPRSFSHIDATNLLAYKDELKAAGKKVTFAAFLVKATSLALEQHMHLNCYQDGDEVVYVDDINVGVAMQGPKGLLVPVIKETQKKNLEEISADMRALSEKVKSGKITLDDMTGGTVTLNSDGTGRTDFIASILNAGQGLLIGSGRTAKEPKVMEDGTIAARDMTWITFVMNHNLTDGIVVSRYTDTFVEIIEDPKRFME